MYEAKSTHNKIKKYIYLIRLHLKDTLHAKLYVKFHIKDILPCISIDAFNYYYAEQICIGIY